MPHIPRRNAATIGIPPELMQPPKAAYKPVPVQQKTPTAEQAAEGRRKTIGMDKINMKTYEPDMKLLLKTMFGKEPDVDPHTGQLVLSTAAPAPDAAHGNIGQVNSGNTFRPVFGRLADPHAHRPPA